MQSFTNIIDLWPEPAPVLLASDLNEEAGTVRQWRNRDVLPDGVWLDVVKSAKRRKISGVSLDRLARIARARRAAQRRRIRSAARQNGHGR